VYCEAPSALISDLRQFRAIRRLVIPPLSNGLEQQLQFYDDADEDEDDEHMLNPHDCPKGKMREITEDEQDLREQKEEPTPPPPPPTRVVQGGIDPHFYKRRRLGRHTLTEFTMESRCLSICLS
jgi:hypothetical protein